MTLLEIITTMYTTLSLAFHDQSSQILPLWVPPTIPGSAIQLRDVTHPGTWREMLENINEWVNAGGENTRILWLHGPAGAGNPRSRRLLQKRTQSARGDILFARTVPCRNDIRHLFPTFALQTALSSTDKRQKLDSILKNDPYITERTLFTIFGRHRRPR